VPLYADGHAGDAAYLVEGILIGSGDVRVALRNDVGYTFGWVVGLTAQTIGASAHAGFEGGLMPIAVRRYLNAPGPNAGAADPCDGNQNNFMDVFATEDTACLGSDTDAGSRVDPSAGLGFDADDIENDPSHHGPIVAIVGQGAQPPGTSSFRGLVVLDIRDFATTTSQVYYNGVTPATNPNTIKQMEAAYIAAGGYPGPPFPASTSPPAANSQVAITNGNSSGIVLTNLDKRFSPGQQILVAIYPGYVMQVPDFTVVQPNPILLPTTGTVASPGTFNVTCNKAFSGTVTLTALPDTNDAASPLNALTSSMTFAPNPITPNGTDSLGSITTSGAAPGIYNVWIEGQAGSPYLTVKDIPFVFQVGTVSRDFTLTPGPLVAAAVGDTATTSVDVNLPSKKSQAFGGSVTLSVDGPLPAGLGAVTISPSSLSPSSSATATLSVATGTVSPGTYTLWLRATGANGDGQPVTHLAPVTLQVATAGTTGNQEYVDIVGYALMRIAEVDSNSATAYAITPLITDPRDPRLQGGQHPRLLPW
jgi:hypothetical protein